MKGKSMSYGFSLPNQRLSERGRERERERERTKEKGSCPIEK